jgi:dihydropteroate synthase
VSSSLLPFYFLLSIFCFMHWRTARRTLELDRPLVMGILNVTPDSFSDGGKYASVDAALAHAEQMIADGADIIDVGGESTRPGSSPVNADVEISRVIPVIELIVSRHDIPVSIDTTKSLVATAATNAGAEIINDISGLSWDPLIAEVAAQTGAALVLMHSRGSFAEMHSLPPVENILNDVTDDLRRSIAVAKAHGVADTQIALDVGIGFGKAVEQNLELIAKLDQIAGKFAGYPLVVGTSRKSFIGKLRGGAPTDQRLGGSIATAVIAAQKGAKIIRVHDVAETLQALEVLSVLQ